MQDQKMHSLFVLERIKHKSMQDKKMHVLKLLVLQKSKNKIIKINN
jgi:hypothetical protein